MIKKIPEVFLKKPKRKSMHNISNCIITNISLNPLIIKIKTGNKIKQKVLVTEFTE